MSDTTITTRRFSDALFIQEGACNPSAIARALVRACDDAREDYRRAPGTDWRLDPAIQLILHQLCFLCGISTRDEAYETEDGQRVGFDWDAAMAACRAAVGQEG
jgi:hypothetical protein